ncbi:hypothetical protein BD410DRAFT_270017 [Rickenella mellea]|uniref:Arrestin-like N-terminal domain-containing protein n=1 Tax=Rickenella mellea TaxID=50990 RepID=A0A4Y7Q3F7_9AGAM|nr:hypothetical protein BD410DRAFT_270017 [Rickenella mellea]
MPAIMNPHPYATALSDLSDDSSSDIPYLKSSRYRSIVPRKDSIPPLPSPAPSVSSFASSSSYSLSSGSNSRLGSSSGRTVADDSERPNGVFMLHDGILSLSLYGQDEGAEFPLYERDSIVDGRVTIANTSGVRKVEAQIDGVVAVEDPSSGRSPKKTVVLSEPLVYWDGDVHSGTACPHEMHFSTVLPRCYVNDAMERVPLPPSFTEYLTSGVRCVVEYSISLTITRVRERSSIWRRSVALKTPIGYCPRSRPATRGPLPAMLAKSRSKPATLFVSEIKSRLPNLSPITTHLYLPNSQICSFENPIPFYLKLSSPSEQALRLFMPPVSHSSFLPFADTYSTRLPSFPSSALPVIRLRLVRRVSADGLSPSHAKNGTDIVIGEGEMGRSATSRTSITWVGEIRVDSKVTCGGFRAKNFVVRDFLILSVKFPEHAQSPLMEMRRVIPVRLTTDGYDCSHAVRVFDI